MCWLIVNLWDVGNPETYGPFSVYEDAEKYAEKNLYKYKITNLQEPI